MNYEKYTCVAVSTDALEFSFVSKGPQGEIQKLVQFTETGNPNIYNLAFGDWLPGGGIDDHVKNDNKDRNKILATVAATVYEFTARYPDKFVFFTGSTEERTRLYRMAITNNLEELNIDFEVFGVALEGTGYHARPFEKGNHISLFWLKEKLINFTGMKTAKKKLKGAAALGVEVKKDNTLGKLSGKVLFPEKLAVANKVVAKLKLPA